MVASDTGAMVAFLAARLDEESKRRRTCDPDVATGPPHAIFVAHLRRGHGAHIADYDPARILREVKAKREIIADYPARNGKRLQVGLDATTGHPGDPRHLRRGLQRPPGLQARMGQPLTPRRQPNRLTRTTTPRILRIPPRPRMRAIRARRTTQPRTIPRRRLARHPGAPHSPATRRRRPPRHRTLNPRRRPPSLRHSILRHSHKPSRPRHLTTHLIHPRQQLPRHPNLYYRTSHRTPQLYYSKPPVLQPCTTAPQGCTTPLNRAKRTEDWKTSENTRNG